MWTKGTKCSIAERNRKERARERGVRSACLGSDLVYHNSPEIGRLASAKTLDRDFLLQDLRASFRSGRTRFG